MDAHALESGLLEPGHHPRRLEAEPEVTHLLLELAPVVREHLDHEEPSTRPERARRFAERDRWLGEMMEGEAKDRGVERALVDRQRLELPLADLDVRMCRQKAA